MKREDVFPSRWLKAADLEGKKVRAIIGRLEMQEMGDDGEKPVLFFTRAQNEAVKNKGLVLNSTNWESIELMHGPESDDWLGKEITLYATKVPFRGKMTDGIRIEYQSTFVAPKMPPAKTKTDERNPPAHTEIPDGMNDEVPF